jgi:hypothetical protein
LKTDHLSIWRQCVCMSQVINIHNIEEEPKNDSSSNRLVLFYRPMTARSALPPTSSLLTARGLGSGRSQLTARSQSCGLPDIGSGQNTGRGANPNKIPNYISKNVVGGQILWSFISTPPVGNMFGHLHFLTHGSLLSYKKKSWCVVIDGQLLIYARATDLKPKEVVLLKLCHFNVEEKVVCVFVICLIDSSQQLYSALLNALVSNPHLCIILHVLMNTIAVTLLTDYDNNSNQRFTNMVLYVRLREQEEHVDRVSTLHY